MTVAAISREDWLERRRHGIGGSDVAAMLGISRYKSPISLWLEKTGMVEPEDLSDREPIYWGNTLEDIVAKEFSLRTGKKVKRKNALLHHPQHPHMIANVDRLVIGERAGLECKTAGIRQAERWEGDEVPDEYYLQCQHYLCVTGLRKWYIAVLIAGQEFIWKEVQRDERIIAVLIEKEAEFWNLVETKTRPEVDGSQATADALGRMMPNSNGSEIVLPAGAELWIDRYREADAGIKAWETIQMTAECKLKEMLGENEVGTCGEAKVTWKTTKGRESFDSKRFKADHPELAKDYVKLGDPSRRFSVK